MIVSIELSGKEYINNFSGKAKLKEVKEWFEKEIKLKKDSFVSFKYGICNSYKIYKNLTLEEVKKEFEKTSKNKMPTQTLKLYAEIDNKKDNNCIIL